jgi:CheY-like chemotaxis protein
MKTQACSTAPVMRSLRPALLCLKSTFELKDLALMSALTPPAGFFPQPESATAVARERAGGPLVYVVDDEPHLTELYTILLEVTGCRVRAFNNRNEALAALKRQERKPDLLVMDHLGNTLSTDRFMKLCLQICPGLRILMASGLHQDDLWFASVRPDRFLQKPFTPDEFLREVKVALNTRPEDVSPGVEFNSDH